MSEKVSTEQTQIAAQLLEIQIDVALRYGIDINARCIQLIGEIDEGTFCYVDSALTLLEGNNKKAITVKINSEGGSLYDALAIVARIRSSKCRIVTEGYGCIMSAASLIMAAGHKRRMSEFAWLMHHEMSYDAGGTHEQVKHRVKQLDREEEMWQEAMAKFTKHDKEYWANTGKLGQDLYLNAEQCKVLGIIDEVF